MTKVSTLIEKTKSVFKDFASKSFFQKCDIISFCLLFLFFIDCAFSGGGKWAEIGPLTLRMVLGGSALLFALPKFFTNIKTYLKNPIFYMFLAFIVFLGFSAIRGYLAKNNMGVLISDIKGFMWLFTVPALVITVDSKARLGKILTAIVIGAWIQAILVLVIYFSCCTNGQTIWTFYAPLFNLQLGAVSWVAENVYRIFMRSNPYLIAACVILMFRQFHQTKIKWHYILSVSVFLIALLMSFTRSLFGAAFAVIFVMVVCVCIFYRSKIKMMIKSVLCVVAVALLMISTLELIYDASYINFAVARTLGTPVKTSAIVIAKYKIKNIDWNAIFGGEKNPPGNNSDKEILDKLDKLDNYVDLTDISDNLRAVTKAQLKELIVKNPIIGNGLGACSARRNGPDEYFYYDMLARMGIVGLALYVAPFIYICIFILRRRRLMLENSDSVALICALIGFWFVTWFNPWMNAALGIAVYALSCSTVNVFKTSDSTTDSITTTDDSECNN